MNLKISANKTILVTGATGFIGKHLYNLLLKEGYKVILLIRSEHQKKLFPELSLLSIFTVNFLDLESIHKILLETNPDVIVHCAGSIAGNSYNDYKEGIVIPTSNLIQTAKKITNSPFFIYLSSASALGPSKSLEELKDEDSYLEPISFYGKAKKQAEILLSESGLKYSIVRPVAVYGAYDKSFLTLFKLAKLKIKIIFSDKHGTMDIIYVNDLVKILSIIIDKKPHQSVFIAGDGINYTQNEILDIIFASIYPKKANWKLKIIIPRYILLIVGMLSMLINRLRKKVTFFNYDKSREAQQKHWSFNTNKVKTLYQSWTPPDIAMKATYQWYKDNDLI